VLGDRLKPHLKKDKDFINCYIESKNWVGGACGMHGIEENCTLRFDVEK
jgi:hypothetical protein